VVEKQQTIEVCLTSTSRESQESFCKAKFLDSYKFAYEKCVDGYFCGVCCSSFIPSDDAHKTELNDCNKQCSEIQKIAGGIGAEEGPEVAFR